MRNPNKATRLKHYKLALQVYIDKPFDAYGLCIELGRVAYGSFFAAPWVEFKDLVKYYPELTEPAHNAPFNKQRISILEQAIKQLEP